MDLLFLSFSGKIAQQLTVPDCHIRQFVNSLGQKNNLYISEYQNKQFQDIILGS